jgi:uncharacterized damage-inducible protein DinB
MAIDYGPVCCEHLEFMQWADNIMLSALSNVPEEKLLHDRGNSFSSLFDTLRHIYLAELVWLKKVTGEPNAMLTDFPLPADIPALTAVWPDVHQQWLARAQPCTSDEWSQPLHFQTRHFGEIDMPLWQIVLHVANHGSYHRGQLATMLRQDGIAPPPTDLLLFYRSRQ